MAIICPICARATVRRSRRRSLLDHLFGVAGILPWRCESCENRFYARAAPFRNLFYAHCNICGNVELQRIAPNHVPGVTASLWRVLHLPSFRCEPCRHKFFSIRPLLPNQETQTAPSLK